MATIARFPIQRKRGPKVRTGPQASILTLPKSITERYLAFFRIGARPERTPGDNDRLYGEVIRTWLERETPGELRLKLEQRIADRRAALEQQLLELDRV